MKPAPLPDRDNDVPLAVLELRRLFDPTVRRTLEPLLETGLQLAVNPVGLSHDIQTRRRSWSSRWSIYAHTGNVMNVIVAIDEDEPAMARLTANREVLTEVAIPPSGLDVAGAGQTSEAVDRMAAVLGPYVERLLAQGRPVPTTFGGSRS